MASSVSVQHTKSRAVIGYPSGEDGAICPLGTTRHVKREKFPERHIINPLLTKLFRSFLASLWTSTPSRSINTQKKNLANIQQSNPYILTNEQGLVVSFIIVKHVCVAATCFKEFETFENYPQAGAPPPPPNFVLQNLVLIFINGNSSSFQNLFSREFTSVRVYKIRTVSERTELRETFKGLSQVRKWSGKGQGKLK